MRLETGDTGEVFPTGWTQRILGLVDGHVKLEVVRDVERERTLGTAVRLVILVALQVALQLVPLRENLVTLVARERALFKGTICDTVRSIDVRRDAAV